VARDLRRDVRKCPEDDPVPPNPPRIVIWSDHAVVKAQLLAIGRADVEDVILARHPNRRRNTGAADWLLRSGRVAIAYNHPTDGDDLTARVVTLWRRV
jgi:hypothetical protein